MNALVRSGAARRPTWHRRLRNLQKACLRRLFELGQRVGLDILPRHFYSQVPDVRALRGSASWRRPYRMDGVLGADVDAQLACLRRWATEEVVAQLRRDPRPLGCHVQIRRACARMAG